MTTADDRVAVIITALDAPDDLPAAIDSAVAENVAEVVIAVDPADVPTHRVAVDAARRHDRVRVVANPGGRTPTGLNAAISSSSAPILARLDAHTTFEPGYVAHAVTTLRARDAAVVGGRQRPTAEGPLQRAIAAAMTSPAGAGGARHRTGRVAAPAETAYLGVFRRTWLDQVGGYDPTLDRNQDYELCHRIRRAGGLVWFDPDLIADYRPRDSWVGLARQYHEFGRWKRLVMTSAPRSIKPRQLAPPVLVAGLVGSGVAVMTGRRRWAMVPIAYGLGLGMAATRATKAPDRSSTAAPPVAATDRVRVMGVLAVMHLAWGTGFWRGQRPSDRNVSRTS